LGRRARWWLIEGTIALGVLAFALVAFAGAKAKFDSDEVHTIGTTRYFHTLFVAHDISPEAWPNDRWTRTHPMVTRYVVGAWLWARGYDLTTLDPTYNSSASRGQNQRAGQGVSDALLLEARVPMRVLAALAVTALYAVVRLSAGRIGGIVAALLVCGSPYLREHLIRAKGEAPLMFFLLTTLLASVMALRAGSRRGRIAWGLVAGASLGLALGAKLTAVLGFLALAAWAIWVIVFGWVRARSDRGPAHAVRASLAWVGVVAVTGVLVFIASNPFLYPDPVGRTQLLFQTRQREMAAQARDQPERAVHDLGERAVLVWERSLFHETWSGSYVGWPVEGGLAILGAGWLTARAVRRRPGPDTLLLLWAVCIFGGVTWGLGFRLQQYFVPTALMATLLAGLAAGWLVRLTRRRLDRLLVAAARRLSTFAAMHRGAAPALSVVSPDGASRVNRSGLLSPSPHE
jgi:4-amino-4-deoxy-L-arabinose transferase-like glycosyltransferase